MSDLTNITVNGVPLEKIIRQADRAERMTSDEREIATMKVISRVHFATNSFRNHSGTRSGRGRVIYSAVAAGGM